MSRPESRNKKIAPGSFGATVHEARRKAGLTLQKANQAAGFSFASGYLGMIECGLRELHLKHVPAVALAVRMSPSALVWLWLEEYATPAWRVLREERYGLLRIAQANEEKGACGS